VAETYDLVIIGGGPAGLTAGIYAGRALLKTVLLEKEFLGGQAFATVKIENYPGFPEGISGPDMSEKLREQAQKFGVEIATGAEVAGIRDGNPKEVVTSEATYRAKAVVVASGLRPRSLDIPGEKEFVGRGVSYCATCDGAFFAGKRVIVVGGGDSAIDEGLFLTRFADKVTVVHRRDELRAAGSLREKAFANPKMDFRWSSELRGIYGNTMVERVVVFDKKTRQEKEVPVDGVFMYVGNIPNTSFAEGILRLDENGYILTDEALQSSIPGIFAAGDVRHNLLKQVVVAMGEGALASVSAEKYIESRE
jgi:thioredoxin reductase (NADPH)